MSTYAEMHRTEARRRIALRERIEAIGDVEIMALLEDHDRLRLNAECGREIRGEWAAQGRELVDALVLDPLRRPACSCDICAISHGLNAAVERLATSERRRADGFLAWLLARLGTTTKVW